MLKKLMHGWHLIRELSGDSAYEQYLQHHERFHAQSLDAKPALTRKAFHLLMTDSRWKGINRCC